MIPDCLVFLSMNTIRTCLGAILRFVLPQTRGLSGNVQFLCLKVNQLGSRQTRNTKRWKPDFSLETASFSVRMVSL